MTPVFSTIFQQEEGGCNLVFFLPVLLKKSGNNIGVTCVTFGGSIWNLGMHSPSTVY